MVNRFFSEGTLPASGKPGDFVAGLSVFKAVSGNQ